MSFKIERGLFKYDFPDHYAVLGVSLDATPDQVRERYKYVARQLHPDSCKAANAKERELATQLFSKLITPAYAHLSKEQQRTEYQLIFKQVGRNAAQNPKKDRAIGEFAKKIQEQTNSNQLDLIYRQGLQKLAAQQYKILSQSLDIIASLSELNLVYMVTKEVQSSPPPIKMPDAQPHETTGGLTEQYIRRAKDHIASKNFSKAILELRDAINVEPNNSTSHSLLGKAYLLQNQPTMANMYVTKALNLNPQDAIALELKKILDKSKNSAKPEKRGFLDGIFRANQK
jgi:curved DNA-binding protein CbpA